MRRVVVEQRELGHHRVERDGAGVVGDHQRAALGRDVLQAAGLDPEPVLVQRPQRGQQHVLGELGVEAELVDLDVAGEPAADERQRRGHLALPLRQRRGRAASRRLGQRVEQPSRRARRQRSRRAAAWRRRTSAGRPRRRGAASRERLESSSSGVARRRRARSPEARDAPAATASAAAARRGRRRRRSGSPGRQASSRRSGRRGARTSSDLALDGLTTSADSGPCRPCRGHEVVEGLAGGVARREAEHVAHPAGVDDPAVGQEAHLLGGEVGDARAGAAPARSTAPRAAAAAPTGRPARRIAWDSVSTPSPAMLKVPPWSPSVVRQSTSRPSRSCTNCSRGSKPEHGGHDRQREVRRQRRSCTVGPTKLANRSVVTATSGRRRAKPRT